MFTLRLTQVALSAATCILVYLCAKGLGQRTIPAITAAALFAISPWFNVIATATSQGFYVAGQTLSMAMLYACIQISRTGEIRVRNLLLVGALAGATFWTANTAIYLLLALGLWLAPRIGSTKRNWLALACGACLGASPLLYAVIVEGKPPAPDVAASSSVVERFQNLIGPIAREYLGVSYAHDSGGLPRLVQTLVLLAATAAFIRAFIAHRRPT